MQKKTIRHKVGRRALLAAAIVVAIVVLSGIALAVSYDLFFGKFYDSLFNNPNVKEIIEVGQIAVSNNIEVTLLSAIVDRYQAYLTIEIRDLYDSRLTDSMRVLNEAFSDGIQSIITGPVMYNKSESKATLALTVLYGYNIAELGIATLSIDTIQTEIKSADDDNTISVVDNVIQGSWSISFMVEQAMGNRILIAYPEDSPVFAKLEVTCSPVMFSIRLTAHGVIIDENGAWIRQVNDYVDKTDSEKVDIQIECINEIEKYYFSFDTPYLTLEDGTLIILDTINDSFDWLGVSFWCPTYYYDIETIHSITVCGEEYFFSGSS